jgi:hypothetical protein
VGQVSWRRIEQHVVLLRGADGPFQLSGQANLLLASAATEIRQSSILGSHDWDLKVKLVRTMRPEEIRQGLENHVFICVIDSNVDTQFRRASPGKSLDR